MDINKYINWGELWEKEICLETAKENFLYEEDIELIKQFQSDKNIYLLSEECTFQDENLYFCFGETGGQNESDTQGWSRDYLFVVDEDFLIIDVEYSQG